MRRCAECSATSRLTTTLKYYVNLETRLAAIHFDRNVLNRRQAARVRLTGRR